MSSDAVNQRPPQPSDERLRGIDGLRATAMLLVFTFHVWEFSGHPSLPVAIGSFRFDFASVIRENTRVDLFIVLSGFCLFLPFCKRPESMQAVCVSTYYIKRFKRIAPPYYAALLYPVVLPLVLVAAYKLLGKPADWQPVPSLWQFVSHGLFIHTLFPETWDGINGSLWTLGLEAQFYLIFPLLIWGFSRWRLRFVASMIALSISYRVCAAHVTRQQSWEIRFLSEVFFTGRMMQFTLGMAAAWFVFRWRTARPPLGPFVGTLAVAAAICIYQFATAKLPGAWALFPYRSSLLGVAFSLLIIAVSITRTPLRFVVENRVMASLGYVSYSIFLIHQPTAWYVSEFLEKSFGIHGRLEFLLLCTVGFAVTLAIALPFFRVFEKPFMSAPASRHRGGRKEERSAALPDGAMQAEASMEPVAELAR